MSRQFEDKPAVRERTPLLVGLVGPSGTGKTYSALRLATGIQRVVGGEVFGIDTEARRMLHYCDRFKFRHIDFRPPFGPLDYLAAVEHCATRGAATIIVDSMSLEHEGKGGVLEMHAAETERLAKQWNCSPFKTQMPAWARPKAERRRLIQGVLQLGCNLICCFRAKEKLKIESGKDPINLGWQPIAGEEFIFEMTLKCLLLPGADGVPTWQSEYPGERAMMKLPAQFRETFRDRKPLDEDTGEALARWAAGSAARPVEALEAVSLLTRLAECPDHPALDSLKAEAKAAWKGFAPAARTEVAKAVEEADRRITDADAAQPETLFPAADAATNLPG